MATLLQQFQVDAFRAGVTPRTKQSMDWFRKKSRGLRRIDRKQLMNDEQIILKNRTVIGSMFMYYYDPKHKETLPYYDRFPLSIIVDRAPGGFYGLNLHYLPPLVRAKFLDGLLDVTNNKKYDESTRFDLTYSMLKNSSNVRYFKPCFKHYLTKHVRSRFALVNSTEWEIVTFLPTAIWEKKTGSQVYKDSRKMY